MTVNDHNRHTVQLHMRNLGNGRADIPIIRVPPHSCDRGDCPKLVEQIQRPNISRVKNVLNAFEPLEDLCAQESVRVGDDSDPHSFAPLSQRFPMLCSTPTWSRIRAATKSTRSSIDSGRL